MSTAFKPGFQVQRPSFEACKLLRSFIFQQDNNAAGFFCGQAKMEKIDDKMDALSKMSSKARV